jgi:hypothetical protein
MICSLLIQIYRLPTIVYNGWCALSRDYPRCSFIGELVQMYLREYVCDDLNYM